MKIKLTKKNRGFALTAAAIILTLMASALIINVCFLEPNKNNSYTTAQIILADGQTIDLDSRDATVSSAAVISQTNSGNGITSTAGSAISRINTNLYLTPSFSGDIQDYTISGGSFTVYVNNGNGVLVYSSSQALSPQHPIIVNGQPVIIASATALTSGAPFTTQYLTKGQSYTMRMDVSGVSISGTFTDGATFGPIMASSQEITWRFTYA